MTHADRDRSELHTYLAADKADYPRTWKGDGYARAEAAEAKVAELEHQTENLAALYDRTFDHAMAAERALGDERAKVARVRALHRPDSDMHGEVCECSRSWPCPTIAALAGDA